MSNPLRTIDRAHQGSATPPRTAPPATCLLYPAGPRHPSRVRSWHGRPSVVRDRAALATSGLDPPLPKPGVEEDAPTEVYPPFICPAGQTRLFLPTCSVLR